MTDEIDKCPTCGTPKMDNAPNALVLFFETDEDRRSFIDIYKEVKPDVKAVPVG